MALSGSRDFIYTRDQIIAAALRGLKVIVQGATPSANQLTGASEALNVMQLDWQNDGIMLWTQTDGAAALTANTPYVTATSNPDIVDIDHIYFRKNGIDTHLTKLSLTEYKALSNKAEIGIPATYCVEYLISSIRINLYPVYDHTTGQVTGTDGLIYVATTDHTSAASTRPTTGADYATKWAATSLLTTGGGWVTATDYYSGYLGFTKSMRVQDFDSGTNNPDFHARAYLALKYGLMAELASEYKNLSETKYYEAKAQDAKKRFMLSQAETGSIRIIPRIK